MKKFGQRVLLNNYGQLLRQLSWGIHVAKWYPYVSLIGDHELKILHDKVVGKSSVGQVRLLWVAWWPQFELILKSE